MRCCVSERRSRTKGKEKGRKKRAIETLRLLARRSRAKSHRFARLYMEPKSPSCYARKSPRSGRAMQLKSMPWKWNQNPSNFVTNQEDHSDTTDDEDEEEDISKATLIWRAIKLPIYSVALIPVSVGSAAAFLHTGVFSSARYFLLLVSFCCIIAWLNLSNDVYDFDTGADKDKKESVVNLTGCRTGTLVAANSVLALGFMLLTWTAIQAGTSHAILLISGAIACGYIYQVLCGLTMPMGKVLVSFVEENHKDKRKIFMAKYYCVRVHTLFGAALAVGLVLARTSQTK